MDRVNLTEDLSFSRIVYGMWRLDEADDTSAAHIQAKIEACLEQGITTIDQADIYGLYKSEELLGTALKSSSLRDKIELISKTDIVVPCDAFPNARVKHYDTSAEHITAQVERSLKLMHTDHLDMLLIHRQDPFMDHHETGQALDALGLVELSAQGHAVRHEVLGHGLVAALVVRLGVEVAVEVDRVAVQRQRDLLAELDGPAADVGDVLGIGGHLGRITLNRHHLTGLRHGHGFASV